MEDSSLQPVHRALLSVSNKAGIVDLARGLGALGVSLISTGGTARALREAGLSVTEVSEVTGFPEIMDGRVKTLHPRIHGGLLGRGEVDARIMHEHGIEPIDLLVVNLYPFEAITSMPDCSYEEAIENIDIGGPAMLRAAAKNQDHVGVIVDPADYAEVLQMLAERRGTTSGLRRRLAAKAFAHTARYDGLIANWLGGHVSADRADQYPPQLQLSFTRRSELRYGENPHQTAALYVESKPPAAVVATARVLAGKELSYNNIADADAALECVKAFHKAPACVIVKHANPCGVALGASTLEAYEHAYATDPVSAFGGIIAFNQSLDETTAAAIVKRQFVEVVIAPEVDDAALACFARKPNVRVLACGRWNERRRAGSGFQAHRRRPAGAGHRPRHADAHRPAVSCPDACPTPPSCTICCLPGTWPCTSSRTRSSTRGRGARSASAPAR